VRYRFVHDHRGQFRVATMCRLLRVSVSGYYAWRARPESRRSREDRVLLAHIRSSFEQSRGTYGSPRIHRDLREAGIACGENRVARLMGRHGIRPEPVRRFRVTTDSRHALPVAANVLGRDFLATRANDRWCSDITYVWTREGWLYLAVILDLFSRRVVGWSLAPTLHKELVLDALEMALGQRRPEAGVVHHSDRGSQYASLAYQERLLKARMVCSMSRRGDCFDNAVVESFFGTLKRELIHRHAFTTRAEARMAIFEYIEVWYNRKRRHSALRYLSPEAFEKQQERRQSERRAEQRSADDGAAFATLPIAA